MMGQSLRQCMTHARCAPLAPSGFRNRVCDQLQPASHLSLPPLVRLAPFRW